MSKPSAAKRARRAKREAKRGSRHDRRRFTIAGVQIPSDWADDRYSRLKIHWAPVGEATCSCCREPISMGRTDQTECDRCEADHGKKPGVDGMFTIIDQDGKKL